MKNAGCARRCSRYPSRFANTCPLPCGVLGTGSDAKTCQIYASTASPPCSDTQSDDGRARQKKNVCGHRQSQRTQGVSSRLLRPPQSVRKFVCDFCPVCGFSCAVSPPPSLGYPSIQALFVQGLTSGAMWANYVAHIQPGSSSLLTIAGLNKCSSINAPAQTWARRICDKKSVLIADFLLLGCPDSSRPKMNDHRA